MISKGKLHIKKDELVDRDSQYHVDADLVRFMNMGQSYILIDEQILLKPGQSWTEGDLNGYGIDHHYQIDFVTNPSPPSVTTYVVYAGNKLRIRLLKRQSHAQG